MAKKVSGIYSITNTVNGKRYYGSSVSVWGRKRQHFHTLRKGTHRNKHLQAAWNLYGKAAFVFALVEEVPVENLLSVEQRYLDANRAGYNVAEHAESAALGLKWSAESKAKLSRAKTGIKLSEDHKKALSVANIGKRKSEAERLAMSERQMGQKLDGTTKDKIASAVKSLWADDDYRARMMAAQQSGRKTRKAKRNYRAANKRKWADPQFASKMSAARKSLWSDPAYRAKMLEVRRTQGQKLRERNELKKRESQDALQERQTCG